jgi:preprotein translocase subunit SecG
MGVLNVILRGFFILVAVLLILLVLFQSEDGDTLGGVFAGGGGSAFGSRAGNFLTRASTVLGGLFLVLSFVIALLSRTPGGKGVEAAGRALDAADGAAIENTWWDDGAGASSENSGENPTIETETSGISGEQKGE